MMREYTLPMSGTHSLTCLPLFVLSPASLQPTGSSPILTYKYLVELHKAGELSFKNVITFNMDVSLLFGFRPLGFAGGCCDTVLVQLASPAGCPPLTVCCSVASSVAACFPTPVCA